MPAGRVCRPAGPFGAAFFFFFRKLPRAAVPEAGFVLGTRCPHTGPPQAHFLRRRPLLSCTKTHKAPVAAFRPATGALLCLC